MDRDEVLGRLSEDLIGPSEEAEEVRGARPSDVYVTGILWPKRSAMTGEEDDRLSAAGAAEDAEGPNPEEEQVAAATQMRPSVAGISFALHSAQEEPSIIVTVAFGTYVKVDVQTEQDSAKGKVYLWKRRSHQIRVGPIICPSEPISVPLSGGAENDIGIATLTDADTPDGIRLHVRSVPWNANHLVTVTLVNDIVPDPAEARDGRERATLFQTGLRVEPGTEASIVARPSRRTAVDEEDRSLALLYRDAHEFAAGHTCSADWERRDDDLPPAWVETTWIPTVVVPGVSNAGHSVFKRLQEGEKPFLALDWLIEADDRRLTEGLSDFVSAYENWIGQRSQEIASLPKHLQPPAEANMSQCREAMERMRSGVDLISRDDTTRLAFRLALVAMRLQYAWSRGKDTGEPLVWRPFQLGFILLSLRSVADRDHAERDMMDLLWFPTGGGKTEAYLALVAFVAFRRRLAGGDKETGVSAVMRYTLRLLTTQQFARAAALILACEAVRRGRVTNLPCDHRELGQTAFSIGLWAGDGATPNRYEDARRSLQGSREVSSPKQLATCPACGTTLRWDVDERRRSVSVRCVDGGCMLHDDQAELPVWTVDEDIYRERPTLLIGTVDKFAQIVRKKEISALFSVHAGSPPDLIIQDELHLISGPLGTVAGLYEIAIDRMMSRGEQRPKVIGSTATIRRASDQVRALFNRDLRQFPPPGLSANDSGFAVREPVTSTTPGRRYAAVTTAGRSAKFTLQAVSASLLQSAGSLSDQSSRDHYGTLVAYFNSLRELGGALVLMQDDVADSIRMYAGRRSEAPRGLEHIEELTSRRTQAEIREMLDMLSISANQPGSVDAVLATNMLSVGVDIPRLGLMVMNGQPKGISEYIQATSRVGRGRVAGLVVAVLNNAKARDRSHFETFRTWHETLYRDVEATSVTPFASRARDRALHSVLVALCRHTVGGMLTSPRVDQSNEPAIVRIIDEITARAADVDKSEQGVREELLRLLNLWKARDPEQYWNDYAPQKSLLQSAERAAAKRTMGWSEGAAWPTLNNMRNVEPSTPFRLVPGLSNSSRDGQAGGNDGQ